MIKLRNNIQISNPIEKIEYYWKRESGARAYDKARLPKDNSFTEDQIKQAVQLINRFGALIRSQEVKDKIIEGLLQKRQEIELRLVEVPTYLTVLNSDEEIPWEKLRLLFDTCRVKYVGLARMTKILHKKRPHLIPILDKGIIVSKYLEPALQAQGAATPKETKNAVCYIKELKKDADRNRDALLDLQQSLESKGYGVYDTSIVRLLDILIWSHFFYKEQT